MNNIQKRILLFIFGCLTARLLIVYVSKNINIDYLPYLGYIALIISSGFLYIYATDKRKTGAETFGAPIWWNNLRPIHGITYGLFAYNATNKNPDSWKILLFDVIFGATSFFIHHYKEGDFNL